MLWRTEAGPPCGLPAASLIQAPGKFSAQRNWVESWGEGTQRPPSPFTHAHRLVHVHTRVYTWLNLPPHCKHSGVRDCSVSWCLRVSGRVDEKALLCSLEGVRFHLRQNYLSSHSPQGSAKLKMFPKPTPFSLQQSRLEKGSAILPF